MKKGDINILRILMVNLKIWEKDTTGKVYNYYF